VCDGSDDPFLQEDIAPEDSGEGASQGGSEIQSSYPGKFVELPDGTQIGLRSSSRSGGATIDKFSSDGTYIKVHLP
jgi:hypothetical protein